MIDGMGKGRRTPPDCCMYIRPVSTYPHTHTQYKHHKTPPDRYFEMVEKHLARKHPQRERAPSRGPGGHHARPGTPGAVRVEKGPTGAEVGDRGAVGGAVEEVLSLLYGAACRSALVGSWSGGGACMSHYVGGG